MIGESIRLNRSKFTLTTGPVIDLFPNSSQQGEESGHSSTLGQLPRELADRTQFKTAQKFCLLHPVACDSTVTTAAAPGLEAPDS